MMQKTDGIARLKNCPTKGEDIRQAIARSRKDFLPDDEAPSTEPLPSTRPAASGRDA